MAFASMDDFVSKVTSGNSWRQEFTKSTVVVETAGRVYDLSLSTGYPTQNQYLGTNNLAFYPMTDTLGLGIAHGGNVSPATKHLVNVGCVSTAATAVPSILHFIDVLGYYPLTTVTSISVQTFDNTIPLPRYTNGEGVRAYIVARGTMGAGTPFITITYTNSAGVGGRTMQVQVSAVSAAVQGHIIHSDPSAAKFFPFLPLQDGDTGIKSIDNITLSATMTSGSLAVVLCRPLTTLPLTTAGVMAERNLMTQLPSLPRIYDGACINVLHFTAAATAVSTPFIGYIETAWS